MPLAARVEKFPHERLYLNFIQILEQSLYAINQECNDELLVRLELVGLSVVLVNRTLDDLTALYCADHLLKNQPLELEAAHMAIISHHCEYVSYHQEIKVFIED